MLLLAAQPVFAGPTGELEPELRERLKEAIAQADSFADRFEAEVWLADMSNRLERWMPDAEDRVQFLKLLHAEAQRVDLPPELVLSVIQIESAFDRYAISVSGAQGYMQIMPFWLDEITDHGDNLFNDRTNLRMGCTVLRYYLDREKGRVAPALARYNGSYGRRDYPDKVLAALNRRWFRG